MKREVRGPSSEVRRMGVALLALCMLSGGCNSLFHDRDRVDDTHGYNKAECEGWLNEAERRIQTVRPGWSYQGDGINVYPHPGTRRRPTGEWTDDKNRGAYTEGGSDRQYVHLFTDPVTGAETAEEGIHEMGHCVLWSHGISGHPAEFAHLFVLWTKGAPH